MTTVLPRPYFKGFAKFLILTSSALVLASCGGGSSSSSGGGTTGSGGGGGVTTPNVAPQFSSATSFTINENAGVEFFLTITDPDSTSVTVTDDTTGDGAFFAVDQNGRVTATTANVAFDFESPQDINSDNVYEQDITLSDGVDSTTTTIRVTITNVDEAPQCEPEGTFNFNENISGAIWNLIGTSIDPEGVAPSGFTLDGVLYLGDSSGPPEEAAQTQFTINTDTGDVVLTQALDAEKLRTEAPFRVSYTVEHGTQFANCSVLFQLVDVPGVVLSGVKFSSDALQIFNIAAVGDVDGDGNTDFVLNRRTFDEDINTVPPFGRLVFGSVINAALALDGAEELTLETLTDLEVFEITGNYPDPSSEQNLVHEFTFSALGDLDADGLADIGLAGLESADVSYIIPSSDIVDALNAGVLEIDIQANFNDESGG